MKSILLPWTDTDSLNDRVCFTLAHWRLVRQAAPIYRCSGCGCRCHWNDPCRCGQHCTMSVRVPQLPKFDPADSLSGDLHHGHKR